MAKLLYFPLFMLLMACQSTPLNDADASNAELALELQRLQERQQQQDQLLNELQQMRPALTRLLTIEEDLYLLIERLQALSQEQGRAASAPTVDSPAPAAEKAPAVASPKVAERVSPSVQPNRVTEPAIQSNFALQITSITEPERLPEIWQKLTREHPQLLADMEPNFQVIRIQNTDYYRLKVGRFSSQSAASDKCSNLKAAGLNCFVVNYTESDFSELSR